MASECVFQKILLMEPQSLYTLHSYVSSSAWDVLFVEWIDDGIPGTRRIIEHSTAITASVGDNRLESMSTNEKRRERIHTYVENGDMWLVREGSA